MNCFCCKNPYKICVAVCDAGATITLPTSAAVDDIYYLDLDYLGSIHTIQRLQVMGQKIVFDVIGGELNECYCYRAYLYRLNPDGTKLPTLFVDVNGTTYECYEICTSLKV